MQKPTRLPSLPVILSWSVLAVVILGAIGVVLFQGSLRTSQDTRNKADVGSQAIVLDGCVLTGCGGEICAEAENDRVSTCVVRPEQTCYRQSGVCRKQADGKCGWTQTAELTACIEKAKSGDNIALRPSPSPQVNCNTDTDCPADQACTGTGSCPAGTQCLIAPKICAPKVTASATPKPLPKPSASLQPLSTCSVDSDCPTGQACLVRGCLPGTQCLRVTRYCGPRVSPSPITKPLPSRIPTPTTSPRPSSSPLPRCTTDVQCGPGQECYQPPMSPCPAGMACAQVMPAPRCRPKASSSPSPTVSCQADTDCPTGQACTGVGSCPAGTQCLIAPKYCVPKTTTGLLGDINGDGKVDLIDYSLLKLDFLTSKKDSKADLNKDTKVDLVDYSIFIQELKK